MSERCLFAIALLGMLLADEYTIQAISLPYSPLSRCYILTNSVVSLRDHVLRKIRQEERNNIRKVPAQNGEQDLGGESCSPVE
jgi:hypothetical protein